MFLPLIMQSTQTTDSQNIGETHLWIGENKTLGDLAQAVLKHLSYNEAYGFKVVFEVLMHSDGDFLARETEWQEMLEKYSN